MMKSMSLSARRELLASVRQKYHDARWSEKGKAHVGFRGHSVLKEKATFSDP